MGGENAEPVATYLTGWDAALSWIGVGANVAAIATAIVAVSVWLSFRGQRSKRRRALEGYLKEVKSAADGYDRRTVLHLMANLRMTEAHIFEAAFESNHVVTSPGQDHTGIANRIYFEYSSDDVGAHRRLDDRVGKTTIRTRPPAR